MNWIAGRSVIYDDDDDDDDDDDVIAYLYKGRFAQRSRRLVPSYSRCAPSRIC